MATHSSILVWRIPWTIPWGLKESDTTERLSLTLSFIHLPFPLGWVVFLFPHSIFWLFVLKTTFPIFWQRGYPICLNVYIEDSLILISTLILISNNARFLDHFDFSFSPNVYALIWPVCCCLMPYNRHGKYYFIQCLDFPIYLPRSCFSDICVICADLA